MKGTCAGSRSKRVMGDEAWGTQWYLYLGKWDPLGETAEHERSPAPGRQTNVCLLDAHCMPPPPPPPSGPFSWSAPCCLLSCLSGDYLAEWCTPCPQILQTPQVTFPSSSAQAPAQSGKWGYAIRSGGGLVEGRLPAPVLWWVYSGRPISITC